MNSDQRNSFFVATLSAWARPKALPLESASLREGLTQASFLGAHRNSANLTQSYAFEDVRSRGHVAQVRQKVLSDFSKKILLGFSFRANPRRGFALFAPLAQIHPLLRSADAQRVSRSAERESGLLPDTPQAFEKA